MIQTLLVASAAGLSALYFIRGAYRDLCGGSRAPGSPLTRPGFLSQFGCGRSGL